MLIDTKEKSVLPLKGAFNFRDMGGILTTDGRKVKKGILFRAAELSDLTEGDKAYLETIGIARIFDYRTHFEAENKPDPVIGQAVYERISVNPEEETAVYTSMKELYQTGLLQTFGDDALMKLYENSPVGNASYQRLMQLLKHPEKNLPLIHHCTGGRDRTGIGAMLILLTLGVSFENIMEDYLFSNVTLADYHDEIFTSLADFISEDELTAFKKMFLLQEKYLQASYDNILKHYRDFETYLEKEHQITPQVRAMIQNYCLENE